MKHFKDEEQLKRVFRLFLACVFCYGIVEGFSLNIFSNFFKEWSAYPRKIAPKRSSIAV